jgi:hypothetical protein
MMHTVSCIDTVWGIVLFIICWVVLMHFLVILMRICKFVILWGAYWCIMCRVILMHCEFILVHNVSYIDAHTVGCIGLYIVELWRVHIASCIDACIVDCIDAYCRLYWCILAGVLLIAWGCIDDAHCGLMIRYLLGLILMRHCELSYWCSMELYWCVLWLLNYYHCIGLYWCTLGQVIIDAPVGCIEIFCELYWCILWVVMRIVEVY